MTTASSSRRQRVVGIDGCRGGWVGALIDGRQLRSVTEYPTLAELLDAEPAARAVGIDMPLGSTASGVRRADSETRKALGPGKASSVFSAPPRPCFEHALDYRAASAAAEALTGKRISKQAFHLLPKMIEAEEHWRARPGLLFEAHPELAFQTMKGDVLGSKKRTAGGALERLALLQAQGLDVAAVTVTTDTAQLDDVLDAVAVAWVADRWARGHARSLPAEPEPDVVDPGLGIAVWC